MKLSLLWGSRCFILDTRREMTDRTRFVNSYRGGKSYCNRFLKNLVWCNVSCILIVKEIIEMKKNNVTQKVIDISFVVFE